MKVDDGHNSSGEGNVIPIDEGMVVPSFFFIPGVSSVEYTITTCILCATVDDGWIQTWEQVLGEGFQEMLVNL